MHGFLLALALMGAGFGQGTAAAPGAAGAPPAGAFRAELTVGAFNVESGGADIRTVSSVVADLQGVDVWAFSEVKDAEWAAQLDQAAEEGENTAFEMVLGSTGGEDRLALAFDAARFERVGVEELHDINPGGRVRSPLAVRLRDRRFGVEFIVVANHLYRSDNAGRHTQAEDLRRWVEKQPVGVILAGDFNFDYQLTGGDDGARDRGYDLLTKDGAVVWARPATLTPTTRVRRGGGAVLDFVFAGGAARDWGRVGEVVVRADDFRDQQTQSDHRAVLGHFDLPGDGAAGASEVERAQREARAKAVRERLAQLEAEAAALRAELANLERAPTVQP